MNPFTPRLQTDVSGQLEGYMLARVVFGTVVQDLTTPGWSTLGLFAVNVATEEVVITDVPIANPSGGLPAASVGDTVMLLQFIDGTTICLGRVA